MTSLGPLSPLASLVRPLSKDEQWWKQGFYYLGFRHFQLDYGLIASSCLENNPNFFLGVNENYKVIVETREPAYHDIFAYYTREPMNDNTSIRLTYRPIDQTQYKLSLGVKTFSNTMFASSHDIDSLFASIVRETMNEWKIKLGKLQQCTLVPWPEREESIRTRFGIEDLKLKPKIVKPITRMIRMG